MSLILVWGSVYYRYLGALAGKPPIEKGFIPKLLDDVLLGISAF
jgi:hypothetical protein